MRRLPAWIIAVVMGACAVSPQCAAAADGFWVTLASGVGDAQTDYAEFSFDSPHAPIVLNQLTGVGNGQVNTGGGVTYFTPASSAPILVPTTDGHATVTPNGSTPTGSLPRFPGSLATGSPQTGPAPSGVNLAAVSLTDGGNGSKVLTVAVTDANGNPLGQASVGVSNDPNAWWVIGLGSAAVDDQEPPVIEEPPVDPPVDPVPPVPTDPTGPVATPEPASVVLLGVSGLTAATFRRFRRK